MPRFSRLAAVIVAALAPCAAFVPSAAAIVPDIKPASPVTVNYSAADNADPSIPERRTWLRWTGITVSGTRYRVPAATTQFPSKLTVLNAAGQKFLLTASATDATQSRVSNLLFRVDPKVDGTRNWGPLLQISSLDALRAGPVNINLVLKTTTGTVVGKVQLRYRYDAALATAPLGNPEWNGPGGRWYVAGVATRTNHEIATPPNAPIATVVDGLTDNYVAQWNDDPSIPDLRTYLQFRTLTLGARSWSPATVPASISFYDDLEVVDASGNHAIIDARTTSTNIDALVDRVDDGQKWGVFIRLVNKSALQAAPVVITISVRDAATLAVIATTTVEYRYDAALANAQLPSNEWNGPGGRWYVNAGVSTQTVNEACGACLGALRDKGAANPSSGD